jgi:protein required for attachment to host cells
MTTWVIVANTAKASLYASENLRTEDLHLLKEFSHPESRKKITDLMCDKPGHYKTDTGMRGAFTKGDPKLVEAEHFALELVKELKGGFDQKKYYTLVIVTPPHFFSLITKHLHFHQDDIKHIAKDYTQYPLAKLSESVREHLFV